VVGTMIPSEFDQPRRLGIPRVATPPRGSIDVRALRLSTTGGLAVTQQGFADAIGVPVKTLRNWKQGRRQPTGPAREPLTLIARDPWIVFDVIEARDTLAT
jgi:putative transcriptional regulator